MIFSTSEPALYVVVLPISCKVKDIIVYRNNRNTVKSANYRSFSRKGPILLSADMFESVNKKTVVHPLCKVGFLIANRLPEEARLYSDG